jgi:NAD(P)-dependent dehydrogenase (short-subunit alcohol dehydrogenase family)
MAGKSSLIIGGAGQLGKLVVATFKNKGWRVLSADVRNNEDAEQNLILPIEGKITPHLDDIYNSLHKFSSRYHIIFNKYRIIKC